MIRAVRPVIVFGLSLAIFSAQAAAVPLAPEDCVRARSEQFVLEGSGVPADMSRGAEWARANLEPERLKRVARWIELQEYILFRCPRPKPPPESAGNTQPRDADDSAASLKKPQKPKAAKKQPSAAQSETGDGAAPPATAAKTKPPPQKPRSEDAYRPPMPYSGDELQHAVPGSAIPLPANGTGLVP
jgi:hypothetical protein